MPNDPRVKFKKKVYDASRNILYFQGSGGGRGSRSIFEDGTPTDEGGGDTGGGGTGGGGGFYASGNLKMRVHRGLTTALYKSHHISGECNYSRAGWGAASSIINANAEYKPIEFYFYTTSGTTFNAEWYITGYK